MKNKLSVALIALGLLIFSYPFIEDIYSRYMQERAFQSLAESGALNDNADDIAYIEFLALEELFQLPIEEDDSSEAPEVVEEPTSLKPIGILKIDRINVKLPIYDGTEEKYLKVGVGRIQGTSNIGEIGNIALAGHRGRSFGRLFNRLDELEIGDEIVIEVGNKTHRYTVYKTHIVKPSDISVLNRSSKHRVLTLVTCDPVINATHRLIVHAVIR